MMLNFIRKLYLDGALSDNGLNNAVSFGWITAGEAASIRTQKTPAPTPTQPTPPAPTTPTTPTPTPKP